MEDIKEYLYDRIVYILVGLNALFQYLGVENIKSSILWFFTIMLLIFKIRSVYIKNKANAEIAKIDLDLKKEQLRFAKQDNFKKERENFIETWKKEFDAK